MEMEELVKIGIAVLVLVIMVGAVIVLVQGKGGEILEAIGNFMRFGGR